MGCGEHKITLWNVEHGYVVATIDLMDDRAHPRTVWAKCDRVSTLLSLATHFLNMHFSRERKINFYYTFCSGYFIFKINKKKVASFYQVSICFQGFLFAIQYFNDDSLELVAINGINYSWKRLKVYKPDEHEDEQEKHEG